MTDYSVRDTDQAGPVDQGYRAVLRALPVGLIGLSRDWRVSMVQGLTEDILASSQRSFMLKALSAVPHAGHILENMRLELESDTRASVRALDCLLATGETLDIHLQTLPEAEMDVYHLVTLIPSGRAADQQSHDRVDASQRSLRGLGAMLAHEIKNPLAGIRGAAQLAARYLDHSKAHLSDLIITEVDRIRGLLDGFDAGGLDAAQGPDTAATEGSNIHDVLNHVMDIVRHDPTAANIPLLAEFDPSLPPVSASRDTLVQIFLNLAQNAVHACQSHEGQRDGKAPEDNPKGPSFGQRGGHNRISFRTRYRQGVYGQRPDGTRCKLSIEIQISDTGPGIDQSIAPFIFEPFVTSREGGTGLGLATVSQLLHQMGGRIFVKETGQKGTVFALLLPEYKPAPHARAS